ncbi:protein of unknown function [Hyphomicrobium sp. 1Nfss2.1]
MLRLASSAISAMVSRDFSNSRSRRAMVPPMRSNWTAASATKPSLPTHLPLATRGATATTLSLCNTTQLHPRHATPGTFFEYRVMGLTPRIQLKIWAKEFVRIDTKLPAGDNAGR